jgi:membrane protein
MVIGIGVMFLLDAPARPSAPHGYFSDSSPGWLLEVLGVLFSLAVTTTFLIVMFRVLPNIKVRFLYVLVGASITAVLFTIGNYVIGRYLGRTSPGSAFGAAGALAVIMIWMYYVSYIIIFGAEVTRAYAHRVSMERLRAAAVEAAGPGESPAAVKVPTTAETLVDS